MLFFCWFRGRPKAAPQNCFNYKNYHYIILLLHNFLIIVGVVKGNINKIDSFH